MSCAGILVIPCDPLPSRLSMPRPLSAAKVMVRIVFSEEKFEADAKPSIAKTEMTRKYDGMIRACHFTAKIQQQKMFTLSLQRKLL